MSYLKINNRMKYFFSFFMLLVYLIIGFFHNSMITFAMQENMEKGMNMHHNQQQVIDCCDDKNEDCNQECCFESDWILLSNIATFSQENNKKEKLKIIKFIDIYLVSVSSFLDKNLVNKTSPPNILRDVKNYSYKDLIKIIKSNT